MELQLQHLCKHYGTKHAVNDVSTTLTPGVYGLLGANGAGKTTLMRMICGVLKPTSGNVCLNGKSIDELGEDYYAHLGYMPQDFGFYPDFTAREFMCYMAAVKGLDKKEATTRTKELLKLVNLHEVADKKIKSFSGGMKQRVVIAMALACNPKLLLADEPTTALDVVVQKGILMMLMRLQKQLKNTMIIVSHDMGVHYQITDRMAIMYSGSVAELGKTEDIFNDPIHPYTKMLVDALPRVGEDVQRVGIAGRPPALKNPPPGCRFAPRCPHATDRCRSEVPKFREIRPGRFAACHLLEEEVKTNG